MKTLPVLLLLISLGIIFAQQDFLTLCRDGNLNDIDNTINAGQDVNIADEYGQTPLMYAAAANPDPQIIKRLLEAGANIDAKTVTGWTALMYAVRDNANPEVSRALLEAGSKVDFKNEDGLMAFNYAGGNFSLQSSDVFLTLQEVSLLALQREFAEQVFNYLGAQTVECPQEVHINMPGTPICAYVNDDENAFKVSWEDSVIEAQNVKAQNVEVEAVNNWNISNDILLRAYIVAGQRVGVVYNSGAIIMLLQFP